MATVQERSAVVTHIVRVAASLLTLHPWDAPTTTGGGGDTGFS